MMFWCAIFGAAVTGFVLGAITATWFVQFLINRDPLGFVSEVLKSTKVEEKLKY